MHRLLLPFLAICLSLSPFLGCESDESRLAAHVERGDAYMEEEAYEEAIIEFRNALQHAPNLLTEFAGRHNDQPARSASIRHRTVR